MQTFGQRKGLTEVPNIVQSDSMNGALRNSIWNVLDDTLWSRSGFLHGSNHKLGAIDAFSRSYWSNYLKVPIDTRQQYAFQILATIRKQFFSFSWYQVYEFVEFVINFFPRNTALTELLNAVLERELSGYRVVSGLVVDIVDEQEVQMLTEALRDTRFAGVSEHLRRALQLHSDRENPDQRNSIKESISAVESMARVVTGDDKATLGEALKVLEKGGQIHTALKEGFLKLYGYTSDAQGIRHAMLDVPAITSADARYFLLSCTSFVNYLKAQIK